MTLWIFGYGSLLFRPDFPHGAPRVAVVHGYERRLDQGSPDHRGTPERLGRVCTLVPSATPDARCWGAVFPVASEHADEVLAALDYRERGGYVRAEVTAHLRDRAPGEPSATVRATTWVAAQDNPYYLGPAPLAAMVAQIRDAVGPSGRNTDYVLRLAETLRAWEIADPLVFELEAALRPARARGS